MGKMKIWTREAQGFESAIFAMRRSYGSQGDSDSKFQENEFHLGGKDLKLMKKLVKAGPSHSSFMRFIVAYLDIEAPRYWWQQFDRYRFGVERLSDSTMHTLTEKPLEMANFTYNIGQALLTQINGYIGRRNLEMAKAVLPESFIQGRTVMCSYQALRHMYSDRVNHKLVEWTEFCEYIKTKVPHGSDLILAGF